MKYKFALMVFACYLIFGSTFAHGSPPRIESKVSIANIEKAKPAGFGLASDNAVIFAQEGKYAIASYNLACAGTAGMDAAKNETGVVGLKEKTTTKASTDGYCCQRVSNYSFNLKNHSLYDGGVSRKYHLHEDPGLKASAIERLVSSEEKDSHFII